MCVLGGNREEKIYLRGIGWREECGNECEWKMLCEIIKELSKYYVKDIIHTEINRHRLLFQFELEMPLTDVYFEPLVFQLVALFWETARNLGGGTLLQEGGPIVCALSYSISCCCFSLLLPAVEWTTSPSSISCRHDVLSKFMEQGSVKPHPEPVFPLLHCFCWEFWFSHVNVTNKIELDIFNSLVIFFPIF